MKYFHSEKNDRKNFTLLHFTPHCCNYKSDRAIQEGAGAAVLWNGHVQESPHHRHRRDLQ